MSQEQMRGLTNFISEVRKCKTKEQEQKRVDKELANVREKFSGGKKLDPYSRKKYTWKLLYIYLLGYDVDVGHMEALQMITSQLYSEKNVGYMACSVLLNENHPLLRLIIQSVKNDLNSKNEAFQCLALNAVANVGGQEFAESLTADVQKLLLSPASGPFVKKKAALALLRLFRKYPEAIPNDLGSKVALLLDENHLGVINSVLSLLLGLVTVSPAGFEETVPKAARWLTQLCVTYYVDPNDPRHQPHIDARHRPYSYWHTMCPWVQIKFLRLLQYFPPPSDQGLYGKINDVLQHILSHIKVTKNVSKNNADHGVLFEALNTIIHYCVHGQTQLQRPAVDLIARFIAVKEPNIRYLGLDTMARLANLPGTLSIEGFKKRFATVKFSLTDPDISIRKRALDLLYAMCDHSNSNEIVEELLSYLKKADYQIKEELVLKIAILAEKFAKDLRWYIDVILQLITLAGDFVSEDIWYRVVQIVTNHEDLQEYAAITVFKALQNPSIHENGVKVGGYILGEFSHSITDPSVTGERMFQVLSERFPLCSLTTKALLLSAFIKLANTYPELKQRVEVIFNAHKSSADPEIQQRAVEYSVMNTAVSQELMTTVFGVMPNFPERESALIKRIKKAQAERSIGDADKEKADEEEEEEDEEEEEKGNETDDDIESKPNADGLSDDEEDQKAPAARPAGQTVDLLGFGDFSASAPASSSSSSFPPQSSEVLAACYGKAAAVVYESENLEISVKVMAFQGAQAKMILYYGNKSDSNFTDLTAELVASSESHAIKVQLRPVEPMVVEGKKQVPHYLLWSCMQPFYDAPSLHVAFMFEDKHYDLNIKLPLLLAQFSTPMEQDVPSFIAAFKSQGNQELKVVKLPNAVDLETCKAQVREGLGLFIVENCEKDPNNFCASGVVHTADRGADGESLSYPAVARFETKPGTAFVRVTVRSAHPQASKALVHSAAVVFQGETL